MKIVEIKYYKAKIFVLAFCTISCTWLSSKTEFETLYELYMQQVTNDEVIIDYIEKFYDIDKLNQIEDGLIQLPMDINRIGNCDLQIYFKLDKDVVDSIIVNLQKNAIITFNLDSINNTTYEKIIFQELLCYKDTYLPDFYRDSRMLKNFPKQKSKVYIFYKNNLNVIEKNIVDGFDEDWIKRKHGSSGGAIINLETGKMAIWNMAW